MFDAALDDAMPVFLRVFGPERDGRFTPDDTRELMQSLARHAPSDMPAELRAGLSAFFGQLETWANEEGRKRGDLMIDSPRAASDREEGEAQEGEEAPRRSGV